jgi:hypothetical protein
MNGRRTSRPSEQIGADGGAAGRLKPRLDPYGTKAACAAYYRSISARPNLVRCAVASRHPLIVAAIASSHLRRTGNALNSTPVYANGLVYIGCTDGYC